LTLKESEILQIDATVITGVLILLSLSLNIGTPSTIPVANLTSTHAPAEQFHLVKANRSSVMLILEILKTSAVLSIVFPFAFSALWVLKGYMNRNYTASDESSKGPTPEHREAVSYMMVGFKFLIGAIAIIIGIQILSSAIIAS